MCKTMLSYIPGKAADDLVGNHNLVVDLHVLYLKSGHVNIAWHFVKRCRDFRSQLSFQTTVDQAYSLKPAEN